MSTSVLVDLRGQGVDLDLSHQVFSFLNQKSVSIFKNRSKISILRFLNWLMLFEILFKYGCRVVPLRQLQFRTNNAYYLVYFRRTIGYYRVIHHVAAIETLRD